MNNTLEYNASDYIRTNDSSSLRDIIMLLKDNNMINLADLITHLSDQQDQVETLLSESSYDSLEDLTKAFMHGELVPDDELADWQINEAISDLKATFEECTRSLDTWFTDYVQNECKRKFNYYLLTDSDLDEIRSEYHSHLSELE